MPDPLYIKLINNYGDTPVVLDAYLYNNSSTSMASLAIEDSSGKSLVNDGIELDGNSTPHCKVTSKFILDFVDNYAIIYDLGLSDEESIYFGVNYFGTVYEIPGSSITPYNMSPTGIDALSLTSNDTINGRIVIKLDSAGEPIYTVIATNDSQSTNIARVSFWESQTNDDDLFLGSDILNNGQEAGCAIMKQSWLIIDNIADGTQLDINCEHSLFILSNYNEMMVDYISVPNEIDDLVKDSVQINAIKVRESSSSSWVTIDESYLDVSLPYIASFVDQDEYVGSIIIVQYPELYGAGSIHVEYSHLSDITSENYKENNPSAVDAKVLVYNL